MEVRKNRFDFPAWNTVAGRQRSQRRASPRELPAFQIAFPNAVHRDCNQGKEQLSFVSRFGAVFCRVTRLKAATSHILSCQHRFFALKMDDGMSVGRVRLLLFPVRRAHRQCRRTRHIQAATDILPMAGGTDFQSFLRAGPPGHHNIVTSSDTRLHQLGLIPVDVSDACVAA